MQKCQRQAEKETNAAVSEMYLVPGQYPVVESGRTPGGPVRHRKNDFGNLDFL